MMKILIASLLYSVCSSAAPVTTSATDVSEILVEDGVAKVSIPAEAKKALNEWNPEFLVFDLKDFPESVLSLVKEVEPNGVPMAFIADLDNNGQKDIVLLGSDLHRQYAVVLTQTDKTWKTVELQSWNFENIRKMVITNEAKAKETGVPLYVLPASEEHAKKLGKKVGVQVERYLSTATVYEVTDGKAAKVNLK